MNGFTLRSPNEVIFGTGCRAQTGAQAAFYGHHALLVTGRHFALASGLTAELTASLQAAGVRVTPFAQVEAEPSLATVERGRAAFQSAGCDLVVAAGGGSALDAGKAIGALATCRESVAHYFAGAAIPGPGHPIIALPTTSGTGAEVTPNAVFTDPATCHKASLRGPSLMPRVALVDPEVTVPLPPEQTAWSGLDALTQAIEAYTSRGAHGVSDSLAREATGQISASLARAVAAGDDLEARSALARGSLLAGLALASARLGLVHGLAHPLGALYHLPHGQVCGLLLPTVMRFNLPVAGSKYAELAAAMGLAATPEALIEAVQRLAAAVGVTGQLGPHGLREADFPRLIPPTLASGSTQHNPRAVDEAAVRQLLSELI
jgi:alcohol dehydrogenase class IV